MGQANTIITKYMDKSQQELKTEWEDLPFAERDEIYTDFQDACIDSGREPSEYWYPFLMPMVMQGYGGD